MRAMSKTKERFHQDVGVERGPIGEELRERHVSVNDMALACKVSNKTAWRWAMGESTPLPAYRERLKRWLAKVAPDFDLDEALL